MADHRKRFRTPYQGVRYREHPTRRNGNQPDRYFIIRTYHDGREREEGLGWGSDGWTAKKASEILAEIKKGQTTGMGPTTLAESRALARARREEKRRRKTAFAVEAMPFCQAALDHFLPWARRNKISWHEDVSRFEQHLWPAIGPIPLRDVTRRDIEAMLAAAAGKGLAPATVRQCLALARRIFNFCSGLTVHGLPLLPGANPCAGVQVRLPDNGRLRFLSYREADMVLEAACGYGRDQSLFDIIRLALNTGMRLGEIQHLRWPDVDLAHGIAHILDHDGKPGGVVYLNAQSRSVLERRQASSNTGALVFEPYAGGRLRGNISQAFKEIVDMVGLNDGVDDPRQRVVFHTLRHTFASWLALAGTDIYQIKDLMRHKTIVMTMRYAHLIPSVKRRAVENLRPADRPDGPQA